MSTCVNIERRFVQLTLDALKSVGRRRRESVVLWLGKRDANGINVTQIIQPQQIVKRRCFIIPESSMDALMKHLRTERLMIAAQIHTHPKLAFHSSADDKWAIVRHAGALSLVVPFFGLRTEMENFFEHTAIFSLSSENEWLEVPAENINNVLVVRP